MSGSNFGERTSAVAWWTTVRRSEGYSGAGGGVEGAEEGEEGEEGEEEEEEVN